ncbi:MAG TPA: prepilin-type N-terminal cleavage/methylation domain-containing protein [Verrucomicrobiae bacterium]|nr:prepilin-type N-terminal cleavage/methylation domain-containing protein [Verrucomicrobiae bacterium]
MKIRLTQKRPNREDTAFTLMEVMMAVIVVSIVFFTVYAGFTFGFAVIQVNRENVRATQILQEKMEMVRLFRWDQVTNNWIPSSFTEYFDPTGGATNGGLTFTGAVTVASAPIAETYASDMRMITVQLNWTSGGAARSRSVTTFVSHYGLQNYIY